MDTYEKETPSKYDPLNMNFFSLTNFHVLLLKLGQEIAKNHDFHRYNHFQQQLFHEMILLIEEKFPKLVDRNTTEEYSELLHQAFEIERNRPIFLFLFPEIVGAMIFSFLPSNELTKLQEIFHNNSKYRKLLDQILSSTEGIHRVPREKQQRKEYEVACQRDWWNYGPNYRMLNRKSEDEILSMTQLKDGRIVYSVQSDSFLQVTVRFFAAE